MVICSGLRVKYSFSIITSSKIFDRKKRHDFFGQMLLARFKGMSIVQSGHLVLNAVLVFFPIWSLHYKYYYSEWRNLIFENHNLKNCFFSTLERVLQKHLLRSSNMYLAEDWGRFEKVWTQHVIRTSWEREAEKRTEKPSLKGTKYVLSLGIVHPICVRWMNKQKEN